MFSAQLEAAVDAVARAERGGEHQPHLKRRPAAALQVLVQDVRRVGEQVRPQYSRTVGLRQLGEVLGRAPPSCSAR